MNEQLGLLNSRPEWGAPQRTGGGEEGTGTPQKVDPLLLTLLLPPRPPGTPSCCWYKTMSALHSSVKPWFNGGVQRGHKGSMRALITQSRSYLHIYIFLNLLMNTSTLRKRH